MEKEITYHSTNTYSTLFSLTLKTNKIWLVFHGIGYLSRYFIRFFQELDPTTNYVIAPQAPSKYYKDFSYKKIGSSWLTKENTTIEIENNLQYIHAIFTKEEIPLEKELVVIGYSQGVSMASRWIANYKINPSYFFIISGAFPKELNQKHFLHLTNTSKLIHIVGENDPYFEKKNIELEKLRVGQILPNIRFKTHPGGHELNLNSIVEEIK
ncbi:serine hydrolase family protein [Aquimarina sp. ERC-38]|uniref:alpha/beta hydrolase n=1 Tax=Aquimarina sp. ERC-38 TaxID=2949996 RepID=UPI00224588DF|nr:esterase [Aquimarina sp. ERC-38]UZO79519.1 serine hydrolase family protein [Aquimarina sp. ERC-38]